MPESPTPAPRSAPRTAHRMVALGVLLLATGLAILGSDDPPAGSPSAVVGTSQAQGAPADRPFAERGGAGSVDVPHGLDDGLGAVHGGAATDTDHATLAPTAASPMADTTDVAPLEDLRLGTVAGRVVDVGGAPVADARIEAHVRYAANGPLGSSRVAPLRAGPAATVGNLDERESAGHSEADGRFEIGVTGVPPVAAGDRLVDIVVTAEGFAACETCRLWVPLGGRIDDVTLVLLRSGRLEGRVVDDVGRPVADVDLVVRPYDERRMAESSAANESTGARPVSGPGATVSDDRGRFAVAGLPEGAVWVGVRDPRWRSLEPERVLVVHPGSTTAAGDVVVAPRD